MKNLTLTVCAILAGLGLTHAQINATRVSNNYTPYHQYLKQSNTRLQNSVGDTKALINNEIAYRHDVWGEDGWAFYDSGSYTYNTLGLETNGALYNYSNSNSKWVNDTINTYTYDQNGNALAQLTQNWDATNNCWVSASSLATSYNAANKPISQGYQVFVANKYWQNTFNYIYTYDANNNQVGQVEQIWNFAAVSWLNTQQITQTIGSNNLVATQQVQHWDSASGTWANTTHTIYTYDSRNNQTCWIEQVWESSQWIDFYKDSSVFDANNNLTALIYQEWDTTQHSWVNRSRSDYTFDANNNLSQYASYNWNANNANWTPVFLNTYFYNATNKLLKETEANWNVANNNYSNTYQASYSYDGNNNLTKFEDYYWGYQGSWIPNTLFSYTIDGNNKTTYELDQAFDPADSVMVNTDQFFYYYTITDATTGVHTLQNDLGAVLYPNPSTGNNINIALTLNQSTDLTLNTYDAQGKLINTGVRTTHNGANYLQISYPALSSGTYFIQVINRSSQAVSMLKFVKE